MRGPAAEQLTAELLKPAVRAVPAGSSRVPHLAAVVLWSSAMRPLSCLVSFLCLVSFSPLCTLPPLQKLLRACGRNWNHFSRPVINFKKACQQPLSLSVGYRMGSE